MIELIQFPWSPFCIVQRRILEYARARFKIVNIPNGDRSLVWRLTRRRYYGVPIIRDGKTVVFETDPVRSPSLAGWDSTVVNYASDLPHLNSWGTGYQLGPGTIRVAHTDHEQIGKNELRTGVERYVRLAQELLV